MLLSNDVEERRELRPKAVKRLRRVQEQLASAQRRNLNAESEWEVSKYSAVVASSKQWLHWIDHRESIFPEADGEWALQPDESNSSIDRWADDGGSLPR